MSTGLVPLMFYGQSLRPSIRPPGHPSIPIMEWKRDIIARIFEVTNDELREGMCGAPIVEGRTGNVAGFFPLGAGIGLVLLHLIIWLQKDGGLFDT